MRAATLFDCRREVAHVTRGLRRLIHGGDAACARSARMLQLPLLGRARHVMSCFEGLALCRCEYSKNHTARRLRLIAGRSRPGALRSTRCTG